MLSVTTLPTTPHWDPSRFGLFRRPRPSSSPTFPTAEEIGTVVLHPQREESVLRRLRAPISYLPDNERDQLADTVRTATRCMRRWVFDEPSVQREKKRLGVFRGPQSPQAAPCRVRLSEFRSEYMNLLAESCVLQREVADSLARRSPLTGRATYVASVRDAMQRHDREDLLRDALDLFTRVYEHEQKRFALGSSLKSVIQRELGRYPTETHQLLLTCTRGDFWSRYDRDLLSYVDHPTDDARNRLKALYFDGDESALDREVWRIRSLSPAAFEARRRAHDEQHERLACARIRKGYAKLGDMRFARPGGTSDAKSNITTIDELLWIDNVLEKYIDHKHLLHHEIYLRLHLARLAAASWLAARGVQASDVTAEHVRNAIKALLSEEGSEGSAELASLEHVLGAEALVFARPDSTVARRLEAWVRDASRSDGLPAVAA